MYLTNTFKLFYYDGYKSDKTRSYKLPLFTNPQRDKDQINPQKDIHQCVFWDEYQMINPDLIITFGHLPRIWFSDKNQYTFDEIRKKIDSPNQPTFKYGGTETPVLPLPHLSGRTNAARIFVNAGNNKEISCKYKAFVTDYLKSL
jgi:hypothetical protein